MLLWLYLAMLPLKLITGQLSTSGGFYMSDDQIPLLSVAGNCVFECDNYPPCQMIKVNKNGTGCALVDETDEQNYDVFSYVKNIATNPFDVPFAAVPNQCVDFYMDCTAWVSSGECVKNPSWMHANCKDSCGMCPGSSSTHVTYVPTPYPVQSYSNCSAALADTDLISGQFTIDIQVGGADSTITNVTCEMIGNEANVVVQHNTSQRTSWSGPAYSVDYSIDYMMSLEDMSVITSNARDCRQYIQLECHNTRVKSSSGSQRLRWYGANDPSFIRNYFPSSLPTGDPQCMCSSREACCCGYRRAGCDCDQKDNSMRSLDKGFLTNKQLLPVVGMGIGDVDMATQYGFFTLGPLLCVF